MPYPDGFSSFLFNAAQAPRPEPRDLTAEELADIAVLRRAVEALEAGGAVIRELPTLATGVDHTPRHVCLEIEGQIELLIGSITEIEARPEIEEVDPA